MAFRCSLQLLFILLSLVQFEGQRHGFNVRIWERQDDPRVWNSDQTSSNRQRDDHQCDRLESSELMRRMRDAGIYDSSFMAPDVQTAARLFPDLGDKQFTLKTYNYVCDADCQQETQKVRKVMQTNKNFRRTTYYYTRPRYTYTAQDTTGRSLNPQLNFNFWSTATRSSGRQLQRSKRQSRQRKFIDDGALIFKHSGRTQGIIGTTVAIQCDGQGHNSENSVPSNLEQMCRQCVAVRQLPRDYYPRILNEVICGTELCIKGHGQCIQRFLPFKVLRNFGTLDCQDWQQVTIQLRTCCDCMVDKNSPIHRYISK